MAVSGLPPFERGIISSISALIGCGMQPGHLGFLHFRLCVPHCIVSVLFTGFPHRAQLFCVASMWFLIWRRRWPFAFAGLVAIFG